MIARRGFTLVELVVATIIGVLVAGAAMTATSQLVRSRNTSGARRDAFARAEAAGARIALDLQNIARNEDLYFAKLMIVSGGGATAESDQLLMLTRATRPVRGDELNPEGDECEVQYKIMPGSPAALWRRADPGLDEFIDAGGVATPLVPNVVSLALQASDGTEWFDDWDSDSEGLPHAVRVTVVAASADGRTRATARRIIAIDRVPLPPPAPEGEEATTEESATGGGR